MLPYIHLCTSGSEGRASLMLHSARCALSRCRSECCLWFPPTLEQLQKQNGHKCEYIWHDSQMHAPQKCHLLHYCCLVARLCAVRRAGRDMKTRVYNLMLVKYVPMSSLTLNIQPGLVPVLSFSINGLTLVSSHIFILYIVQMEYSSWFADLMIWWEVCGVHLSPNNMRNGAEKTHKKEIDWIQLINCTSLVQHIEKLSTRTWKLTFQEQSTPM